MLEQYLAMSTEFKFLVIDANRLVEHQQAIVRELVAQKIDLAAYRRAESPVAKPSQPDTKAHATALRDLKEEEAA
jgi:hypothetical protein